MWVEEMTEGGQRVQTSSYKINKILVRMVSRVEYIVHVSKSCWSRFEKFSPHIQKHCEVMNILTNLIAYYF